MYRVHDTLPFSLNALVLNCKPLVESSMVSFFLFNRQALVQDSGSSSSRLLLEIKFVSYTLGIF